MGCYKLFNLENNSVLCFYYNKICDTNFTDPVPACAGMTGKENKCVFLNSLTTLALRATPSAEGNFSPRRYVPSSPPSEGCPQDGVVIVSPPPDGLTTATPPPQNGAVGILVVVCRVNARFKNIIPCI